MSSCMRPRSSPSEHELRLRDVARELAVAQVIVMRLARPGVAHGRRVGQRSVQRIRLARSASSTSTSPTIERIVFDGLVEIADRSRASPRGRSARRPVLVPDSPATDAVRIVEQLVKRLDGNGRWIVCFSLRFLDDHLELFPSSAASTTELRVCVGLNVETGGESRRWQHREVRRVVVDRVSVEIAAARLCLFCNLADASSLCSLEEHVLEHVGDSADVIGLIEVSGFDVRHDRDDGRRRVATDQHSQAVRKNATLNRGRIDERCHLRYCRGHSWKRDGGEERTMPARKNRRL